MARDWAADLWPASYKGVPFFVERDKDGVGKRLVIHTFPNRDVPFIEDIGAKERTFDVAAYVCSDTADSEADALTAVMLQTGAGTLILPAQGPLQTWAHTCQRDRERDKAGYFAFTLQFVLDGASSALSPVNFLGQLVFDANDAAAQTAASLLATVSLQ